MAIQYEHTRKRFTVDEYNKMGRAGIFNEDDRVELIDGEIVAMSPINEPHAMCVDLLTMLFAPRLVGRGLVRVQSPIFVDNFNEPQPDLAILRLRVVAHRRRHPGPEDIMLVIEVSDTTVSFDRRVKVPRYARGGIPEVWIINLPKQVVEVYSEPEDGKYQSISSVGRGGSVTPQALPDVAVAVADFLVRAR